MLTLVLLACLLAPLARATKTVAMSGGKTFPCGTSYTRLGPPPFLQAQGKGF